MLAPPSNAHEQRKTVTVLFCDVTGSTTLGEALDPERLRALLARYFERMKAIVEHHGGTVEKFIGDAVMAVFGVPVVHEDDALRAVRAAAEMRDALPEIGLQGRIGVMTGEVVTGTAERLATGDAVNVAARLEQAAQPGEVLVGGTTAALLGKAAELEPLTPLELKGKSEPVPAHRLVLVRKTPERRYEISFVGRERELEILSEQWDRVRKERRCELVTIVGDAGVGKSRLVDEALHRTASRDVRGRCLPYGEGITYWPVVEVLRQLGAAPTDEAVAVAIGSLLGENDAPTTAEEIAWAFRKTVEHAAAEQPQVVVFDDIQWGEETFLDLVEHVALLSSGAPILLLCLARPELVDRRTSWPVTIRLEPLADEDVAQLMPEHIAENVRARIARAAGGNPLFIGEMLAMAAETEGDVMVPPTLRALLAARLDQLETAERNVLERGAIEGEIFHRGAVQALAPEEDQVTPRLAALVRKELIRPDTPALAGEDGFRFRHLLIRDAAYDSLPKAVRAELHERFAVWLEARGRYLVELDEVLGYHLEQAWRYRAELGLPDDRMLAPAASRRLSAAGRRAHRRSDFNAAVGLLQRAVALVPPSQLDLALETELVDSLLLAGKGDDAVQRADLVAERASKAGDRVTALCGALQAAFIRTYFESAIEDIDALVQEALPVLTAADNDIALYAAYRAIGWVAFSRARTDAALEAFERASVHASKASVSHDLLGWCAIFRLYGTTPVSDVLAWLDEQEPRAGPFHWLRASRAMALAYLGRFGEARAILAETREGLADRGAGPDLGAMTGIESAMLELLAGDPVAAAEFGAEGCRHLEEMGERGFLSTAAATLAEALYALDRLDEADIWAGRALDLGSNDDAFTQLAWRQVRAKVLARRGQSDEAERLAREALAIADASDFLNGQGEANAALAEVLVCAGKADEATAALERALERYERKGNLVSAEHTRTRLGELRAEARK